MKERAKKTKVIDVYADVHTHRSIADMIRARSTNKQDIRDVSLEGLNLSECRNVLDLGCGFGFFTESLKNKISKKAVVLGLDIIGKYESAFLETCKNACVEGIFQTGGASTLKKFPKESFDLILCSYAIYFFPEALPYISRILKRDGIFIVITHHRNNLMELTSIAKDILIKNKMLRGQELPIEKIIKRFSSENGLSLLSKWFGKIKEIDYINSVIFRRNEISEIIKYFLFKSPFFLTQKEACDTQWLEKQVFDYLHETEFEMGSFTIIKNDKIFICSLPYNLWEK